MNLFSKPKVRVIQSSQPHEEEIAEWGRQNGYDISCDADDWLDVVPEFAGRLCYLSFNNRRPAAEGKTQNETYLDHILEVAHGSVLEHSSVTYLIEDVSRNMTHELVRHRIASFSQLSQRYVFHTEELGFLLPPESDHESFLPVARDSLLNYNRKLRSLLDRGIERKTAQGYARHYLLGCAGTKIVLTLNMRSLLNFLFLRSSPFAELEIRQLACAIHALLPNTNILKHITVEYDAAGNVIGLTGVKRV